MCLFVKKGCKPEITRKDIVCYKSVYDRKTHWSSILGFSPYRFRWNRVETARYRIFDLTTKKWIESPIGHLKVDCSKACDYYINEGFHARTVHDPAVYKERICVIPAGTEYCFGTDGDIVAVQMIVFRTRWNYLRYRIKKLLKR